MRALAIAATSRASPLFAGETSRQNPHHADGKRKDGVQEHDAEQHREEVMREDRVEISLERLVDQPPVHGNRQHEEQRQPPSQRPRHREPGALIGPAECGGPRILLIGELAHLRHGLRHVDGELVWRRVLARMQARTAVVAEIGEIVRVGLIEFQPPRHRRKHRAEAFAIAARVADLHDARDLGLISRSRRSQG